MARRIGVLTGLGVGRMSQPGYHADGGGLYLQVSDGGAKSWIFRFTANGRRREMGLGALHTIGLSEARDVARDCRKLVQDGKDPIEIKRQEREKAAGTLSFDRCAELYIEAHKAGWRNAKHASQWTNTLDTYASPVFGKMAVDKVGLPDVLKVLEPIWHAKSETASRLRARIEAILDWATVRGYREGDNPARWRGHLSSLLPARAKIQRVEHHAALPYADIAAFVKTLRKQDGTAALALEFAILTAGRTSEVIGARWDEIDLEKKLWTIPAGRIKAGREHRVPLSARAIEIIEGQKDLDDAYVFPGRKSPRSETTKSLSNMAMLQLLKRMKRDDLTTHGFRSTFRDWAAEKTDHPREVAEMALAHTVDDKVEAAYRRGDLFEKRRQIMDDWMAWCRSTSEQPAGATAQLPLSDKESDQADPSHK